MPGPAVIIAARYQASPVGPYSELLVAEPARVGLRPGWCVTNGVVDSSAARVGARLNWGFPKELGSLVWEFEGNQRELRWVELNQANERVQFLQSIRRRPLVV